jgi:hypothetical protein
MKGISQNVEIHVPSNELFSQPIQTPVPSSEMPVQSQERPALHKETPLPSQETPIPSRQTHELPFSHDLAEALG